MFTKNATICAEIVFKMMLVAGNRMYVTQIQKTKKNNLPALKLFLTIYVKTFKKSDPPKKGLLFFVFFCCCCFLLFFLEGGGGVARSLTFTGNLCCTGS